MNVTKTLALFDSKVLPEERAASEIGVRGQAAYWKLSSHADPHTYGVVWTPGDRWFALHVSGGYSYDYFEEDTPDDEAIDLIVTLMAGARAYVAGEWSTSSSRVLKIPFIRIRTEERSLELRLSFMAATQRALGRHP